MGLRANIIIALASVCLAAVYSPLFATEDAEQVLNELYPKELGRVRIGSSVNKSDGSVKPKMMIFNINKALGLAYSSEEENISSYKTELRSSSDLHKDSFGTSNNAGWSGFGVTVAAAVDYKQSAGSVIEESSENLVALYTTKCYLSIDESSLIKGSEANYGRVYGMLDDHFKYMYDELLAEIEKAKDSKEWSDVYTKQQAIYKQFGDSVVIGTNIVQAGMIYATRTHQGSAQTSSSEFDFGLQFDGYGVNVGTSNAWKNTDNSSYNLSGCNISSHSFGSAYDTKIKELEAEWSGTPASVTTIGEVELPTPQAPPTYSGTKYEPESKELPITADDAKKMLENISNRQKVMDLGITGDGNDPWTGSWADFCKELKRIVNIETDESIDVNYQDQDAVSEEESKDYYSNIMKRFISDQTNYIGQTDPYEGWRTYGVNVVPLSYILPGFEEMPITPQNVWTAKTWLLLADVQNFSKYLSNVDRLIGPHMVMDDQIAYEAITAALPLAIKEIRNNLSEKITPAASTSSEDNASQYYDIAWSELKDELTKLGILDVYTGVWQTVKDHPVGCVTTYGAKYPAQVLPIIINIKTEPQIIPYAFLSGWVYDEQSKWVRVTGKTGVKACPNGVAQGPMVTDDGFGKTFMYVLTEDERICSKAPAGGKYCNWSEYGYALYAQDRNRAYLNPTYAAIAPTPYAPQKGQPKLSLFDNTFVTKLQKEIDSALDKAIASE